MTIPGQIIYGTPNGRIQPIDEYMAYDVMFRANAKNIQFLGVNFANPNMYKGHLSLSPANGRPKRQGAIDFGADFGLVDRCNFKNQLNAVIANITNAAHGTKVLNSNFWDCLGTGAGPDYVNNPYPNSNGGEDRGDAVTLWGSGSVIANCYANCLEGQDARIAFHFENTGAGIAIPRDFDRMGNIMTGNVAYGSFRRHFALENIHTGISKGNVSLGGATWYAEMAIGTINCIMENTLRYTRKPTDLQGGNWGPVRGAIGLANSNKNLKVKSNVIIESGSSGHGVVINTRTAPHDVEFEVNMINEGSSDNVAVYARATLDRGVFNGIRAKGFARQVSYFTATGTTTDLTFNNAEMEGNGTGNAISTTGGGSQDSISAIGGRWTGNQESLMTASPVKYIKFNGVLVGPSTYMLNVFSVTAGGYVSVQDCASVGNARVLQRFAGSSSGEFPFSVPWEMDGNTGITHSFTTPASAVSSLTSYVNASGKFAGKLIAVSNGSAATTDILIAQGGAANSRWKNITNTASLGDITPA